MNQSAAKSSRPDNINFQILKMINSNGDKSEIESIVEHEIQLEYHLKELKKAYQKLIKK